MSNVSDMILQAGTVSMVVNAQPATPMITLGHLAFEITNMMMAQVSKAP